jgi:hypothetical protein
VSGVGACMFCDKELFFKERGFNEALKSNVDVDLTRRLHRSGRFRYFEEGFIITSMRRFEKQGYILSNLLDIIRGTIYDKIDRDAIR